MLKIYETNFILNNDSYEVIDKTENIKIYLGIIIDQHLKHSSK